MTERVASEFDAYIGQRIRQGRALRKLSQPQLAERLELAFQQIQKYEKGANRCNCHRLMEIANALELPITWFLEGAPGLAIAIDTPQTLSAEATRFLASKEGRIIAERFHKIPQERTRRLITTMIETLSHPGQL